MSKLRPGSAVTEIFTHWETKGRTPCSGAVENAKRDELVTWMLRSAPIPDIRKMLEKHKTRDFAEDIRRRLNERRNAA